MGDFPVVAATSRGIDADQEGMRGQDTARAVCPGLPLKWSCFCHYVAPDNIL